MARMERTETWENWPTFSNLDATYTKNAQIFNTYSLSWQNSHVLPFWFVRNVVTFQSSSEFRFCTIYDVKTTTFVMIHTKIWDWLISGKYNLIFSWRLHFNVILGMSEIRWMKLLWEFQDTKYTKQHGDNSCKHLLYYEVKMLLETKFGNVQSRLTVHIHLRSSQLTWEVQ